eukprot:TRINITY_DN13169_c0_g1_i1.p1 TRINITY_DN13169_c0_g1~~TRINITY_DN13169_c0_g1_i1.p1  ORF type:complete len:248 (+),score=32.55 TRINITY_DN13169_c0_g1_i1:54-797(+)
MRLQLLRLHQPNLRILRKTHFGEQWVKSSSFMLSLLGYNEVPKRRTAFIKSLYQAVKQLHIRAKNVMDSLDESSEIETLFVATVEDLSLEKIQEMAIPNIHFSVKNRNLFVTYEGGPSHGAAIAFLNELFFGYGGNLRPRPAQLHIGRDLTGNETWRYSPDVTLRSTNKPPLAFSAFPRSVNVMAYPDVVIEAIRFSDLEHCFNKVVDYLGPDCDINTVILIKMFARTTTGTQTMLAFVFDRPLVPV